MSQFKNINDKSMILIMEQLQEQFDSHRLDVEAIKDYVDNEDIVDGICKYFGVEPYFEDYTYLCEMFNLNSNIELPLKRPYKKRKVKVTHKEYYVKYGINYWEQTIDTYTILDSADINAMRDNNLYNWWEGKLIDDEETDYETQEDNIDDIDNFVN
jgi:hypothetical protein